LSNRCGLAHHCFAFEVFQFHLLHVDLHGEIDFPNAVLARGVDFGGEIPSLVGELGTVEDGEGGFEGDAGRGFRVVGSVRKPGRSTARLRARLSKCLYSKELATEPRPSGSGWPAFLHRSLRARLGNGMQNSFG
jgi:hypothetical protein